VRVARSLAQRPQQLVYVARKGQASFAKRFTQRVSQSVTVAEALAPGSDEPCCNVRIALEADGYEVGEGGRLSAHIALISMCTMLRTHV
jgi:hypothetical protein